MEEKLEISVQITPNPNTLRFGVNRNLIEKGSINFPTKELAEHSRLAKALFEIKNVSGVMIGLHFISVTKIEHSEWTELAAPVTDAIRAILESEGPLFDQDALANLQPTDSSADENVIEKRIRQILDEEIRPAVAMDGGDVTFYSFHEGILTLNLQGACSSCPSAVLTLKMGIENRLREEIPEIKEVVQV